MKREYVVSIIAALLVILSVIVYKAVNSRHINDDKMVRVGFVYNGDESMPYTNNFMIAKEKAEDLYGDSISVYEVKNVSDANVTNALNSLVEDKCDIIFSNSAGFGNSVKAFAATHKNVEFCQATCNNANDKPVLPNYHTFMGEIYQGRYVSGVVAGLKLKSMIEEGEITKDEALIGYVAAYPYAEVISGYTSFLLGIRSIVPEATMKVKYTNTWGDYDIEYETANELIDMGCVIISQHSDTTGPAVACEKSEKNKKVYHVGYNESMISYAPTTSLISCKIDWDPYIVAAIGAMLEDKSIEKSVKGHVHGNDVGGGFKEGWVEMRESNDILVPENVRRAIVNTIKALEDNTLDVFKGDYIGVNPDNPDDTIDLTHKFEENANSSAPTFNYILKDVIEIVE